MNQSSGRRAEFAPAAQRRRLMARGADFMEVPVRSERGGWPFTACCVGRIGTGERTAMGRVPAEPPCIQRESWSAALAGLGRVVCCGRMNQQQRVDINFSGFRCGRELLNRLWELGKQIKRLTSPQ